MAHVSNWVIFLRAFMVSLLVGAPASRGDAQPTDSADWARSVQIGTSDAYFWYLRRNPTGEHIGEAIGLLRSMGALESRGSSDGPEVRGLSADEPGSGGNTGGGNTGGGNTGGGNTGGGNTGGGNAGGGNTGGGNTGGGNTGGGNTGGGNTGGGNTGGGNTGGGNTGGGTGGQY